MWDLTWEANGDWGGKTHDIFPISLEKPLPRVQFHPLQTRKKQGEQPQDRPGLKLGELKQYDILAVYV